MIPSSSNLNIHSSALCPTYNPKPKIESSEKQQKLTLNQWITEVFEDLND